MIFFKFPMTFFRSGRETWKGKMEFLERRRIRHYFPLVHLWDGVSPATHTNSIYDSLRQFIVFKTTINPFCSAYVKYTYYVYSWKFFLTDQAHRMDAVFVSSLPWWLERLKPMPQTTEWLCNKISQICVCFLKHSFQIWIKISQDPCLKIFHN